MTGLKVGVLGLRLLTPAGASKTSALRARRLAPLSASLLISSASSDNIFEGGEKLKEEA